ncbi:unnamed protein product [Trichogramma brassicae]|uniref:Uncharacterized protein n=1 Tax=Trichogramma brassicae TaxID=86971 RepID=A0A6H5I770_9HYME|nr:unnamed protein product [Trichogramma brassicae]
MNISYDDLLTIFVFSSTRCDQLNDGSCTNERNISFVEKMRECFAHIMFPPSVLKFQFFSFRRTGHLLADHFKKSGPLNQRLPLSKASGTKRVHHPQNFLPKEPNANRSLPISHEFSRAYSEGNVAVISHPRCARTPLAPNRRWIRLKISKLYEPRANAPFLRKLSIDFLCVTVYKTHNATILMKKRASNSRLRNGGGRLSICTSARLTTAPVAYTLLHYNVRKVDFKLAKERNDGTLTVSPATIYLFFLFTTLRHEPRCAGNTQHDARVGGGGPRLAIVLIRSNSTCTTRLTTRCDQQLIGVYKPRKVRSSLTVPGAKDQASSKEQAAVSQIHRPSITDVLYFVKYINNQHNHNDKTCDDGEFETIVLETGSIMPKPTARMFNVRDLFTSFTHVHYTHHRSDELMHYVCISRSLPPPPPPVRSACCSMRAEHYKTASPRSK